MAEPNSNVSHLVLNLPGWRAVRYREYDAQYNISVELTTPSPDRCKCGAGDLEKFGLRTIVVRDMPIHGKYVGLRIQRQRYRCQLCRKTFHQTLHNVAPDRRMTMRLADYIGQQSARRTFSEVAREVGVKENTIRNVFKTYSIKALAEREKNLVCPQVLGIDEIYLLGKPRTIFSNIDKRTILEIHPNRHRKELANFIEGLKDRHSIQVVCQDMYQDYRRLTRRSLSWAVLVVDKFHVVRMANNAIDKARLKLETTTADRRKLRSSRRLFLAREHKQGDHNKAEMQEWFQKYPDLAEAYRLKELFYRIFDNDVKNRSPLQASDMYSECYCQLNETKNRRITSAKLPKPSATGRMIS